MNQRPRLSLEEVMERLRILQENPNHVFEETPEEKAYLDAKKKVYHIQFEGSHRVFTIATCVRLEFKEETMRRDFEKVIKEVQELEPKYKIILNEDFWAKHGILSAAIIEMDEHVSMPVITTRTVRNPETGEYEEIETEYT